MDFILETNKLEKKYGKNTVLKNLNIHVEKGAIYGLIGKNGAGKTTLIRIICGLQKPTSGTFFIYGVKNNNKKIIKQRKRMGAIIENPAIYLSMSAEDNLKQQYKIVGLPSNNGLHEILKFVNLDKVGKKPAKDFSLGMKQRLGIAIALVGNPDFLILDEPINGLDPEGIIEIRELILRLKEERGITVLLSSHYLDELSKIATHYGFLDKGKIIKEISKKELEEKLRKKIQIKVNNVKECVKIFEENNIDYEVNSSEQITIYSKVNISKLAITLSNRNCIIKEFNEKDESLENYYMNLIGGEKNV